MLVSTTRCVSVAQDGWADLRAALWPETAAARHAADCAVIIAREHNMAAFLAYDADGLPLGFAEVSLRQDYVEGTSTSPVAYLEGVYVVSAARRQGVARALLASVEAWGCLRGCREFACDASLTDLDGQAALQALGFEEAVRVVCYRKTLG